MYKVAVLMSTYNGEKYLREQIDSILAQRGMDITLFIRDDGSKDKTIDIIEDYKGRLDNIYLTRGENVGVGNSFMELLYSTPNDYDFYAFSDQDDIWKSNKLLRAINKLEETGATLYASNQECIDADGQSLYIRYAKDKDIHLSPLAIMSQNQIAGCTFVFPKAFYSILCERRPSSELLSLRIHDVWVAMSAAVVGKIYYDKESFIKYRQHENNVVGASENTRLDVLKKQIDKIKNKDQRRGRSMLANETLSCYPEQVEDELFVACANPHNFSNMVEILKNKNKFVEYSGETGIGFVIKVLLQLF